MSGSGLGLSIVVTLAEAQGGAVRFEAADPGACFVLTLPAEKPPVASLEPELTGSAGR
jgi:signal transduction histidine kinase